MPQHATLTDLAVRAAEPPQNGARTLWDGSLKHFGLRVSQGGAKSFIVLLGSGRRQAIGRWPTISLAQARTKAKTILAERTLGRHQPQSISWKDARDNYLAAVKEKNRETTAYEYERILDKHFRFGAARLSSITKSEIVAKVDKCKTASMRKHALVAIKIFFKWAQRRGYLEQNPTESLVHNKQPKRARVLSDEELCKIWRVCEHRSDVAQLAQQRPYTSPDVGSSPTIRTLPESYCIIVKLLILTGQRRGEIAALNAVYYSHNQQTICLPSEITKNHLEHTFPISSTTSNIFNTLGITDPSQPKSRLLFPASRKKSTRPFSGWSKSKKALDQASGVTGWTLHDLRRTYRSNLGRLGVSPHIAERIVNHVSSQSDMQIVYDRYTYMPEMRQAVEKYDEWFTALIQNI